MKFIILMVVLLVQILLIMAVWNWALVPATAFKTINVWQAWGILILGRCMTSNTINDED